MFFLIAAIITIGAILPSFVWLIFFLREDLHPEPKRLIIYVFSLGALITIPTLLFQFGLQKFIPAIMASSALPIFALALIEETAKFIAVYFAVKKDPAFDEPVDAMIYMITAALGFAAIENLFVLGNTLSGAVSTTLLAATNVLLIRFVGATLLHVLSSGILGYYWIRGKTFFGIIAACIIHSIFNYLILVLQNNNLIYASIFLIIASFFLFHDFEKLKGRFSGPKTMV